MKLALILASVFLLGFSHAADAQQCPREDAMVFSVPSVSRVLKGRVIFHDGIRPWFGLKLDAPVCGKKEMQLILNSEDETVKAERRQLLETIRGCEATVRGKLDISATAYYSTDIFQTVEEVKPDSTCVLQHAFPDTSYAQMDTNVRSYVVTMIFDYGKNLPVSAVVRSGSRELHPWQVYADYFLNGEEDATASCADGFRMKLLSSSRNANAQTFDNQVVTIAPETGDRRVVLRFECKRR